MGRDPERAELRAGIERVVEGRGSLVLLTGGAGIGKTRLADEVATGAALRGLRVHWGRCWEGGGAPPYWPWAQLVRSVVGEVDARPRAALGDIVSDLAGSGSAGDRDRFELFEAVRTVLAKAAAETPLLCVLDDLHAADEASLLLLRFLAQALEDTPMAVLGAYRPGEARRTGVAEHLAEVARAGNVVPLAGLGRDEVTGLVRAAEPSVSDATGRWVHEITAGNPLFVSQISRLVADAEVPDATASREAPGASLPWVPDGVRDAVRAWLAPLSAPCRELLGAGAVMGATLDLAVLAVVLGLDDDEVERRIDEAAGHDVVRPVAGAAHQVSFTHPLLRESLYDDLGADVRRTLHRGAASAIESLPNPDDHLDELSHHLLAAGPEEAGRALDACRRAAILASDRLAYEDAARHIELAMGALGALAPDDHLRCRLLLDLGRYRWREGRRDVAEEAFEAAFARARELDEPELVAEAAVGGGFEFAFAGDRGSLRAARCREALAGLPAGDSALRARLLASLSVESLAGPHAASTQLAGEAVAVARRVGEPLSLGYALAAEHVSDLGPDGLDARLASAEEMLEIAGRCGSSSLGVMGRFLRVGCLVEQGDTAALDAAVETQARVVDELAEPGYLRHVLWFRAMRAILDGRVDDAERLAEESFAAASAASDPDAFMAYGAQVSLVRWIQGRLTEMETLYRDMARELPLEPLWPAVLARVLADQGRHDEARGTLGRVTAGDFGDVPRDRNWFLTLATASDAAVALGALDDAAGLFARLRPYTERIIPIGQGIGCWGSVARPVGRLAGVLGRDNEAVELLSRAVAANSRMGGRPFLVHAQLDLTDALVRRGSTDRHGSDVVRARELVAAAWTAALDIGMPEMVARCEAHAEHLGGVEPAAPPSWAGAPLDRRRPEALVEGGGRSTPSAPRAVEPATATIAVLGGFSVTPTGWDQPTRWTSRKARVLLKVLVAHRNAPVPREVLMDLLWPDQDPALLGNRLSVALSTVRRALAPDRSGPGAQAVVADRQAVRLSPDGVVVDVEHFLADASYGLSLWREGRHSEAMAPLRAAQHAYRGDVFAEDPYESWAVPLRDAARSAFVAVNRTMGDGASSAGDTDHAESCYLRVLDHDPYDEDAHLGLVGVLSAAGAHGEARQRHRRYVERMTELGVDPKPMPRAG